jgi:hypothetical protein
VVWLLTKQGQQLRCEVSHGDTPGSYRIVITLPDRTQTIEEIEQPTALVDRTVSVMKALHDDGWQLA